MVTPGLQGKVNLSHWVFEQLDVHIEKQKDKNRDLHFRHTEKSIPTNSKI